MIARCKGRWRRRIVGGHARTCSIRYSDCTYLFVANAHKCSIHYSPCTCLFVVNARRCPTRCTPCSGFFGGNARRCPTRYTPCTLGVTYVCGVFRVRILKTPFVPACWYKTEKKSRIEITVLRERLAGNRTWKWLTGVNNKVRGSEPYRVTCQKITHSWRNLFMMMMMIYYHSKIYCGPIQ